MSYSIVTDTSANLTGELISRYGLKVVPFSYYVEGEEHNCMDIGSFDGAAYYDSIRNGTRVSTSQINPQRYMDCMRELLERGEDVLYVGMSSGISGAYSSSEIAARELREEFPEREIRLVDTYSASLGEGILVLKAAQCREEGMSLGETTELLLSLRKNMCQVFTVDDLMHLRKSGRISNITAVAGMVLKIKPLLKGDELGRIVSFGKVIGRKRAVRALAEKYEALAVEPQGQIVGIAHADCPEDAASLAQMLINARPPKEILTVCYEPVTGSHVGPGALALFFMAGDEVRTEL